MSKKRKKDPKKIASEIAGALWRLGRAAKRHKRKSKAMTRAVESAIGVFGAYGIVGGDAVRLIAAVIGPEDKCKRCGAEDDPMSGELCVACVQIEQRAAYLRSFNAAPN